MPIIGAVTGGLDFSNYFIKLSSKVTADSLVDAKKQGAVLGLRRLHYGGDQLPHHRLGAVHADPAHEPVSQKEAAKPAPPTKQEELLTEIRDLLKARAVTSRSSNQRFANGRQTGPATSAKVSRPQSQGALQLSRLGETFEAGIALTGTEVKSLRTGKATIAESYADARGGETLAAQRQHLGISPGRPLQPSAQARAQAAAAPPADQQADGAVEREGMTLVPLKLYFNEKGRAKIELALARGKKLHDKRETEKQRSWDRERGRLLRSKG